MILNFFTILVVLTNLMQSASPLSSAGKMILNEITDPAGHQVSQAVIKIIRSLVGDRTSAMDVIKVTSLDVDMKNIDLFVETVIRNNHGFFEYRIRDYSKTKVTQNDVLLIVDYCSTREIENFLLSCKFESHKKVLIVLLGKTFPPLKGHIKLMLDIMWRKFILNVNVVTVTSSPQRNGDVHLNTYFPFSKDFCGQVHPVVWNIYRNGTFLSRREHFPRKNENLFKCPLNVAVFDAPPYMKVLNESGTIDVDGVDGNLLKTLSNELNFNINYEVVSEDVRWGELYANQSATGAIELVRCSLSST